MLEKDLAIELAMVKVSPDETSYFFTSQEIQDPEVIQVASGLIDQTYDPDSLLLLTGESTDPETKGQRMLIWAAVWDHQEGEPPAISDSAPSCGQQIISFGPDSEFRLAEFEIRQSDAYARYVSPDLSMQQINSVRHAFLLNACPSAIHSEKVFYAQESGPAEIGLNWHAYWQRDNQKPSFPALSFMQFSRN